MGFLWQRIEAEELHFTFIYTRTVSRILTAWCHLISSVAHRVSRSETSGTIPTSQGSGIQTVSEYTVEDLVCDESELCFEEARAQNYFRKLREQQEKDKTDFSEFLILQLK